MVKTGLRQAQTDNRILDLNTETNVTLSLSKCFFLNSPR